MASQFEPSVSFLAWGDVFLTRWPHFRATRLSPSLVTGFSLGVFVCFPVWGDGLRTLVGTLDTLHNSVRVSVWCCFVVDSVPCCVEISCFSSFNRMCRVISSVPSAPRPDPEHEPRALHRPDAPRVFTVVVCCVHRLPRYD